MRERAKCARRDMSIRRLQSMWHAVLNHVPLHGTKRRRRRLQPRGGDLRLPQHGPVIRENMQHRDLHRLWGIYPASVQMHTAWARKVLQQRQGTGDPNRTTPRERQGGWCISYHPIATAETREQATPWPNTHTTTRDGSSHCSMGRSHGDTDHGTSKPSMESCNGGTRTGTMALGCPRAAAKTRRDTSRTTHGRRANH